jgi:hypothetical protein
MGAPNSAEVVGPNHEANARLIAAAPQMRTALDSMVLNYAQSGRVTDEFVRDVARMLLEIDA